MWGVLKENSPPSVVLVENIRVPHTWGTHYVMGDTLWDQIFGSLMVERNAVNIVAGVRFPPE